MAEAASLIRSFRVGKRTCTMTIQAPRSGGATNVAAEWSPNLPNRPFTKQELRQYRTGRDAVVAEFAAQLGDSALVIETPLRPEHT